MLRPTRSADASTAPILARSPIASTVFVDTSGKKNIRVYYQDAVGNIKETYFRQGDGWHSRPNNIIGKSNLNNGLAATNWNNGNEIRVYYLDNNDKIVERCYSSGAAGWYDGDLTGKFSAPHYSALAAVSFRHGNDFRIRVYHQDMNDQIRELCRDNEKPWTQGVQLPMAVKATSIAVTTLKAKPNHIWLWFQLPDTSIVEYLYQNDGNWKRGIFKSQLRYDPGAYISAASHGNDSHRVYTVTKDNILAVTAFDGPSNAWQPTEPITDQIPFGALGAIPVAGEGEPESAVRIYNQRKPCEITEWGTYDGKTYKEIIPSLPIS